MVAIYYRLIIKGLKTINDVPEKYQKSVQELIDKQ